MTNPPPTDLDRAAQFVERRRALQAVAPRSEDVVAWLDVAQGLCAWPLRERWNARPHGARVFLVSESGVNGAGWFDLRWCVAEELLGPSRAVAARASAGAARVVPIASVLGATCRACGAPALVVGREFGGNDAAGDPVRTTQVLLLCLAAPHVTCVQDHGSYDWCSV